MTSSATPIPSSYDPDKATNYEIGWKLSFPSLRATFNGAAFRVDWKNVQGQGVTASATPINYYRNIGDVVIDGLELEGGIELWHGLMLRSSLSLLDARLAEDYVMQENPFTIGGRKGDAVPFVASVSGSLSLTYRRPLGASGLNGFGILNGQYQGERSTDYENSQNPRGPSYYEMDAYWTTSAQLGVENERWRAALYADNLFDDRAEILKVFAGATESMVTNRPRTAGVFVRYSFD